MRLLIAFALSLAILPAQYYVVSTIAGNGRQQINASGTTALNAKLITPRGIATDAAGNTYFADTYYSQVFQVTPAGVFNVIAGTGRQGTSGDGGPATAALLDTPLALAVDSSSNLYIADSANGNIRRVTPAGIISTFATISGPNGMAFDSAGLLYVSSASSHTVSRIAANGTISVYAGSGTSGFSGDSGPATAARLFGPSGLAFDSKGNLFIADTQNNRIRRVTPAGVISTVAGDGNGRFAGDNGQAILASLASPLDVALDASDILHICDFSNGRVRIVNPQGLISTIAGGGTSYANGSATQATLPGLTNIVFDKNGDILSVVSAARQIRIISKQVITTLAGVLPSPNAGDGVPAITTSLLSPYSLTFDPQGNLLVSDTTDNRVRSISPAGIIGNAAGNGLFGIAGDNGPATAAQVGAPRGLAYDRAGNLFITSGAGATIRKVAATGLISRIAGGSAGYAGDGGPAISASLFGPNGIATDAPGNIFFADTNNHRIRRIDALTQIISTYAGTGAPGFSGDDGPAGLAQFNAPRYVAFDTAGNLYLSDTANHRVRRITPTGTISTVAGTGTGGFSGDGGPATSANLGSPTGIAVDKAANLYIASGNRIRKVDAATRNITTIAGSGQAGSSGEGILASNATLDGPEGLSVDADSAIFFVDSRNFLVRKLTPSRIVAEGVTNAATIRTGPVAPGEIITIFGFDLGLASGAGLELDSSGKVTTQLAGTRVLFDGVAAPLLYVSAGQINVVVPYAVATSTRLQVIYEGRPTNTITLPVVASSPGLFAVTNQDGSVNTASNPAARDSVLILYGTGEGQTSPAGVDGSVATSIFPKPLLDVSVTIGGRAANVGYAGAAPGFVAGVFQINVTIPAGLTGPQPLLVKIGDATTPTGRNINVR